MMDNNNNNEQTVTVDGCIKPCNYGESISTKRTDTVAKVKAFVTKNRLLTDSQPTMDSVTDLSQIDNPLQKAWVETILQHGPHQLMWTFVFKGSYADHVLNDSMNFIICCLNRKLSGSKNFDKNGQCLKGFFGTEQTRKGLNRGGLHYHLLTKEFPNVPDEVGVQTMNELLINILPRAKYEKREMITLSNTSIQLIDNEIGAAAYITKEIGFAASTNGNNVGTIEPRGLLSTGLERNRIHLQG